MSTAGFVSGLAVVLIAGILDGSWNAAFSPKLGLAVALFEEEAERGGFQKFIKLQSALKRLSCYKRNNEIDLEFHNAWLLHQIYAVLVNIPVCVIWAGGTKQVSYIVSQASSKTICLVVLFSVLWGVGRVMLGISCRVAGVGLGTNLWFLAIMLLGTALPLAMDGLALTTFGAVVCVGIFICCIGLYFSTVSLRLRDQDEAAIANQKKDLENQNCDFEKDETEKIEKTVHSTNVSSSEEESSNHEGEKTKTFENFYSHDDGGKEGSIEDKETSTFFKIGICVLGGFLGSMLQFAFIFGDGLVKAAEESPNTPASGSAAVVWLFAISLQFPASFIYALMKSTQPLSALWHCPWWRHLLVLITTSIPWIIPVHIYGLAISLLPDKKVAASVAWPVLMTSAIAQGMILSIILGEWKFAGKEARKNLKIALTVTFVGVIVLMLAPIAA